MSFCGAALLMLSAHWFPSGKEGQLPTTGWFWAVRIRPRGYGKSSTWGRGCNRGFGQSSHCPLCRAFADPGIGLDLCPRTALMPEEPNPERVHRYSRAANALTLRFGCGQTASDTVTDELSLKICDGSEYSN